MSLHDTRSFLAFLVTIGVAALFLDTSGCGRSQADTPPEAPKAAPPSQDAPNGDAPGSKPQSVPDLPGLPKVPKPPPKKAADGVQPTKRPPDNEIGQALWRQSCVPCHGEKGEGDGPAAAAMVGGVPTLKGRIRSVNAETIEKVDALLDAVQNGKGRMPAYSEDIDRGDARRILFYVRDQLEGKGPGGPPAAGEKGAEEKGGDEADAPAGDAPGGEGQ